jgi:hypothetical protein
MLCAALILLNTAGITAQKQAVPSSDVVAKPKLTSDEIVTRLQARNQAREMALRKLEGTRVYRLQYQGILGARSAEVVILYRFVSPNDKEFSVVSEKGSRFLIDHVIKGLLEAERESATNQNQERAALTTTNYNFTPADAGSSGNSEYALHVSPKTDNKFLYRGKIWVDPTDFAVTRVEAEPARSPSFWVRNSKVCQQYEKIGDFWLPLENRTESSIRMGGRAVLSIEYKDYKFIQATPIESAGDSTNAH